MGFQSDSSKGPSSTLIASPEDWLVAGGEMGKLIRSMDWSKTQLGPIESWPQSLRTTVSLCLASNLPISLACGPQHVQIYNDGYWPICGGKHPRSMGQDFTECWAAAWPALGEAFERALAGETSYLENQRMFLNRNGYLEETCFTFSFSPIRDESGGVGGLFHPVTETTSRMLNERRTRCLRDLAALAGRARTMEEGCTLAAQTLADYELDLPLVLFYLFDALGIEARLTASTGLQPGHPASPAVVNLLTLQGDAWSLPELARSTQPRHFNYLEKRLGQLQAGPYPESLKEALALPIILPGKEQPAAILIAGVSTRLPLNDTYRAFYDLLAAGVTAALANGRSCEEEGKCDSASTATRAAAYAEEALHAFRLRKEWAKEREQANKELEAFSYSISHDLRAPLRAIDGFSRALLDEYRDKLDQQGSRYLDRVRTAAQRMAALIDDLLHLSRISRAALRKEPVSLSELARAVADTLRERDPSRTVSIEIAGGLQAHGDARLITIVLESLLGNAWKYTSKCSNAQIAVGQETQDDETAFFVRDNGAGFDMAYADKLFAPFQRLHQDSDFEGTGIGLATVQRVISRHGGRIWAEAQVGKGATFRFTLGKN